MLNKIQVNSEPNRFVRKRSDIDIMANILGVAKKGTKKTHIMYSCNLSYNQLQIYLHVLCEMGLLALQSKENGKEENCFKTEMKGFEFLEAYRELKSLMT